MDRHSVASLTSVSKRQSPETKIRGSVGNTVETEFNGMDGLMDHDFTKLKLRK